MSIITVTKLTKVDPEIVLSHDDGEVSPCSPEVSELVSKWTLTEISSEIIRNVPLKASAYKRLAIC